MSEAVRLHRLETLRTARYALLGAEGPDAPVELWYVLHGYRQLARRFLRRFRGVASPERLIVAPEGLSRFYVDPPDRPAAEGSRGTVHGRAVGASWMTREDRDDEIRDYVRYLERVAREVEAPMWHPGPVRVLLGFSQGAHTAVRWAVRSKRMPDRLIVWGSSLPRDLSGGEKERLASAELTIVRGSADRLRDRAAEGRDDDWLSAVGASVRVVEHPGGHEVAPGVLARVVSPDPGSRPSGPESAAPEPDPPSGRRAGGSDARSR